MKCFLRSPSRKGMGLLRSCCPVISLQSSWILSCKVNEHRHRAQNSKAAQGKRERVQRICTVWTLEASPTKAQSFLAFSGHCLKGNETSHRLADQTHTRWGAGVEETRAPFLFPSGPPEIHALWCLFFRNNIKMAPVSSCPALSRIHSPYLVLAVIKTLGKRNTRGGDKHLVKFTPHYVQVSILHITSSSFPS